MKNRFINLYMDWAKRVAEMSYARRLKVGAVIVKDDSVISYGYNGTPAGWDNNCEDKVWDSGAGGWLDPDEFLAMYPYEARSDEDDSVIGRYGLKTKPEVLHAEMNALMKLAKTNGSGKDASLFITHAPCIDCAKGIYQAGISHVYYDKDYRDNAGIKFLERAGISINYIGDNNDN